MTNRTAIVAEARGYLGTPFVHQARVPGEGLDCIGVIVCAGRACGLEIEDYTRYSRQPNPRVLLDYVERSFFRIDLDDAEPGDIAMFYWRRTRRDGRLPQHVGLLVDRPAAPGGLGLLHAHDDIDHVEEVDFEATWRAQVYCCWRYRGLRERVKR